MVRPGGPNKSLYHPAQQEQACRGPGFGDHHYPCADEISLRSAVLLLRGLVRQRINDFARLGVVELLARLMLDGIRIGLEMVDAVVQARVVLLQLLDLLAEFVVLSALLLPEGQAMPPVDNMPGQQQGQSHCGHGAGGAPAPPPGGVRPRAAAP